MNANIARLAGATARFHRNERGQAMFLGLFYVFLLAGLVFMVVNAGKKTNDKIAMQNAADAVAGTGGVWVARGMNTAAMCNVTQTQLMSMILMLDTMETVAPVAEQIIDDLLANINTSAHGSDPLNQPLLKDWMLVQNAQMEQQVIRRFVAAINDVPVSDYCAYDSGVLWQCCYVLQEMKEQMARIVPDMALRQAVELAEANGAEAAFFVPFYPELPILPIDGTGMNFNRFERPMRDGDRVFAPHRDIDGYRRLQGYRSRRNGRTLGPFLYMREPLCEPTPMGLLELSRFSVLFRMVSDAKFRMLFGGATESVHLEPEQRIEDYDELVDYVFENGEDAVVHTYWSRMQYDSRYEYNTAGFHNNIDLRHQEHPRERLRVYEGFRGAPSGYRRAVDAAEGADPRHDLWYRSTERRTVHYPQLGIYAPHPPFHEDGSPWPYEDSDYEIYYRNSFWRFNGADVGLATELHRRYLPPVGMPPRLEPILLDPLLQDVVDQGGYHYWGIFGFAMIPGEATLWPGVFADPLPTEGQSICFAQAEVFASGNDGFYNDAGFDLFTQNWRVRIGRMVNWDLAAEHLEDDIPPEADFAGGYITEEMIAPVRKMFEMYDEAEVERITH